MYYLLATLDNNMNGDMVHQGDTVTALPQTGTSSPEEVTTFHDTNIGYEASIRSNPDSTYSYGSPGSNVGDITSYLRRPIVLRHLTFGLGGNSIYTFYPWAEYLRNTQIAQKTAGFAYIRAKMKVKFVINATPFHYGRLMASYEPLAKLNETGNTDSVLGPYYRSQRQKIFLNPTTNSGGVLELPFFYFKNWIKVDPASDEMEDLGEVTVEVLQAIAAVTDSATSEVDVTVFGWLEDVELCYPSNYTAQAGDEMGETGVISGPANVLAAAAGRLTSIPFIGPYALATKLAAGSVASIAKIFGYSRPLAPDAIKPMRNLPLGRMATVNAPEQVQPLSLDFKQELTIDSRTAGLDGSDNMSICCMTKREGYVAKINWFATSTPNTTLTSFGVAPHYVRTNGSNIQPTPLAFASNPFRYWTGTLKYRFMIVASAYHRGRIRVRFDPLKLPVGADSVLNNFNHVLDLAECRDFTIEVPWANAAAYQRVGRFSNFGSTDDGADNGGLSIDVINQLNSPDGSNVVILIFVSAGDDFQLRDPYERFLRDYIPLSMSQAPVATAQANETKKKKSKKGKTKVLEAQSGEYDGDPVKTSDDNPVGTVSISITGTTPTTMPDEMETVYFGDPVTSWRSMLKRYTFNGAYTINANVSNPSMIRYQLSNFPTPRGYSTGGHHTTVNGDQYNYVPTDLFNYLRFAFVGMRGALRVKYTFPGASDQLADMFINRADVDKPFRGQVSEIDLSSSSTICKDITDDRGSFWGGSCGTIPSTQRGLEAQLPFYSPYRFLMCQTSSSNNKEQGMHELSAMIIPGVVTKPTFLRYNAIGEDFTFLQFLNAPTLVQMVDPLPSTS